jgi:hypothetical protein
MDGEGSATKSKEQFDQIVERLVLPRILDNFLEDPSHVQVDRIGDAIAAALLIPMSAREKMKPLLGKDLTENDIAKLAMVPVRYVRMVTSDRWDKTYDVLRKL